MGVFGASVVFGMAFALGWGWFVALGLWRGYGRWRWLEFLGMGWVERLGCLDCGIGFLESINVSLVELCSLPVSSICYSLRCSRHGMLQQRPQ